MHRRTAGLIAGLAAAVTAATLPPTGAAPAHRASVHPGTDRAAAAETRLAPASRWELVDAWSGEGWLRAVDCTDGSHCTAVGTRQGQFAEEALVLRWNGIRWHRDHRMTRFDVGLGNVACPTVHHCFVTSYVIDVGEGPLRELKNGSWRRARIRDPREAQVTDIACGRINQCLATGYYDRGTFLELLMQRWDGRAWHRVDIPALESPYEAIEGVDCARVGICWAAGFQVLRGPGRRSAPLVLKYHPGQPVRVAHTPVGSGHEMLADVACIQATRCYAVGIGTQRRVNHGIVMRLAHRAWSKSDVTGPHISLSSVSCRDRGCFTVGQQNTSGSETRAYAAELRSGALRRDRLSARQGTAGWASLDSVSCFARGGCLTVGSRNRHGEPTTALVLRRH